MEKKIGEPVELAGCLVPASVGAFWYLQGQAWQCFAGLVSNITAAGEAAR